MNKAGGIFLTVIVAVVAAFAGADGLTHALIGQMPTGEPAPITNATRQVVQWAQIIGAVVGMIFVGLGAWAWYRVAREKHHVESLQKTADIYAGQIDAQKSQVDQLMQELRRKDETVVNKERELVVLRARTDITAVIGELNNITTQAEKRFEVGTELLRGLLTTLTNQGTETITAAKANYELLVGATKTLEVLAKQFRRVEIKVDHIAHDELSEPDRLPPEGERRKQPRR